MKCTDVSLLVAYINVIAIFRKIVIIFICFKGKYTMNTF